MALQVLVVGGGIGGLCLAQALRKAGVGVQVFERDAAIRSRGQGYRFRITPEGDSALQECLPEPLYALYRATSNRPSPPPVGAYDYQFHLIHRMEAPPRSGEHIAVDRRVLRQVLLGGLDEVVHFDHALASFDADTNGVRAHFANGRTVEGDMLVAADGIQSVVRRQLLPQAEIFETDMGCIYGAIPLNDEILAWLPKTLYGGFIPVLGPDRCTLALGMYRSCRPAAEAAAEFAPTVPLDPTPDYLMWMFVAPKEELLLTDDPAALHAHVLEQTQDWHPDLRRVLEGADAPATFPVAIRSSRPVPPWQTGRVTLLGDAIHAMTPAGGIGANTALFDAALLARELSAVERGEAELWEAIGRYETILRDHGFAAVERSLQAATQLYRISLPATSGAMK